MLCVSVWRYKKKKKSTIFVSQKRFPQKTHPRTHLSTGSYEIKQGKPEVLRNETFSYIHVNSISNKGLSLYIYT